MDTNDINNGEGKINDGGTVGENNGGSPETATPAAPQKTRSRFWRIIKNIGFVLFILASIANVLYMLLR
jgi:hypothetical protein